ncbi:tumor necrosis factor receptor superfamily member 22-like isoform X3 [Apus apus]|uniref:tumor necrosis factor receptor superfamily member 22-like isoform X3 n=1 Tax=Apus apus TaxID=8895 RepID=UPI0021F86F9A|nr:tumor necrosis factor receptor superfamily member 22-like isoform X3 [Apus apus]
MRGSLPCAPRRLCLPLLLLVEVTLGTPAAPLNRRDKLYPLDPTRDGEDFYQVQDSHLYCRKCPAGTYVAEHCKEQNGSSKCLPCKKDEYIEYPNDFPKCLGCQTCREDQVELSPCRATSNTQCVCRNGTFCSPDHPCEMCQKCRPRCPEGEVELAPCTPHSDRRCGPATTTSGLAGRWIVLIVLGLLVVVLLGVFVLWQCYRCHSSGDGKNLSSKSCSVMDYLRQQLRKLQQGGRGTQDNIRNEHFWQDQLLLGASSSVTPSAPGPEKIISHCTTQEESGSRKSGRRKRLHVLFATLFRHLCPTSALQRLEEVWPSP